MDERRAARLREKYASQQEMGFPGGPGPKGKRGPGGPGPHGRMPGGKPKNMKQTIGRLWRYISAEKGKLALVFVCVILGTITNLAGSYLLRPIVNSIAEGKGLRVLMQGLALRRHYRNFVMIYSINYRSFL